MGKKNGNKIGIVTLGCAKNTVDSERLLRQAQLNNFEITDDPNDADTVIINTCGFIEAAKRESIDNILNAIELKKQGKIKRVFVAGCLSERYMEDLKKEIPEVDVYFGAEKYKEIITELGGDLKYELLGERKISTPSHYAYLKISEGCDNPCSFCAIPLIRGKHRSKSIEDLIRETEYLAANGVKELIIIGQDTTDYGKDIYGTRSLSALLNKLSMVKGIEWIRLLYAYPSHFPEDIMDEIASNPKICKYLDMPLQHISDNMLKSMRRGITKRRTMELLFKIKEKIPNIALRTTFIVGYPGETEADFAELCDFVKEMRFDRIGVFTYSQEESTSAYELGDTVPEEIKEERKAALMEIQKEISYEKNRQFLNKDIKVLVDGIEGDFYISRSEKDAPEVDCEILIPKDKTMLNAGDFCSVKVYDNDEYDLYANII